MRKLILAMFMFLSLQDAMSQAHNSSGKKSKAYPMKKMSMAPTSSELSPKEIMLKVKPGYLPSKNVIYLEDIEKAKEISNSSSSCYGNLCYQAGSYFGTCSCVDNMGHTVTKTQICYKKACADGTPCGDFCESCYYVCGR